MISLSAQQLEKLSKVVRIHEERVESLCCMVTKVTCSTKGSNVAKKIDAWVQKELRDSQYSCVQRKQRVQHPRETERKQD